MAHPTTVSRCELTPIIETMRWIIEYRRSKGLSTHGLFVRCYSDSEYTVRTLYGGYTTDRNQDLWQAAEYLRKNLDVEFRYRSRNSHYYMCLCDALCSMLRRHGIEAVKQCFAGGDGKADLNTINPVDLADLIPGNIELPVEPDNDDFKKGLQDAKTQRPECAAQNTAPDLGTQPAPPSP